MNITTTSRQSNNAESTICAQTKIRSEACMCRACARFAQSDEKYRANRRDVLALIDLVAGCLDIHRNHAIDNGTWSDAEYMSYLRGRLMEMAIGFAVRPDGADETAQSRLENALCTDDQSVGHELIEAL